MRVPADTIDRLLAALYGSVSFGRGGRPDLGLLRQLFHPAGRLARVRPTGADVMTVDEFCGWYEERLRGGAMASFHEAETSRTVQEFGHVAQVFSAYEARWTASDPAPFDRGVNSIQLVRESGRWWVLGLAWDVERPDNPLPPQLGP
jgi:hypothetical protein